MATISASVGRGGVNRPQDVRTVQELLNKHIPIPLRPVPVNGVAGGETITAIEEFQRRVVKLPAPDGRVDPGGRTLQALSAAPAGGAPPAANRLSGAAWWHANQAKYQNSTSVDDLDAGFRANVQDFLAALKAAGAAVTIATTRRSKPRAYLMHHSWKIANGQEKAPQVPAEPGVDIAWDHGSDLKSQQAAKEMVNLFGMAHIASLTSNHIQGKAIDMTITWTGTLKIKDKAGKAVEIGAPNKGADNTALHTVGAGYGVKKLATDAPHWSVDGH